MPLKTTGPVSWLDDLASSTGLQRIEPVLRDLEQKQQTVAEMPPVETPKPYTSFSDSVGAVKSWIDRMRAPEAAAGQPQQPSAGQPQATPTGAAAAGQTGAPAPQMAPQSAAASAPGQYGEIDNSSRQAFVRTAWPYMLEAAGGNTDAAEMMLAAAISENGTVGSGRPLLGNSFYGIKGAGTAGSYNSPTWESVNGQRVNINDDFAAYNTPQEGFRAFFEFLQNNSRYAPALERYRQTGDAVQLFRDVNAAGYATNPTWWADVQNIRDTQVAPVVRGGQRQSLNAGGATSPAQPASPSGAAGVPPASSAALPPTVAQKWQQRTGGAEMTAEDLQQLRMLGVVA